jgi:hypothetical protein
VAHGQVTVLERHVVIRRRDGHRTRQDRRTVLGPDDGQRTGTSEDRGEMALPVGREMQHDEHRCTEIARQRRDKPHQRLDAAGGCPDDDPVSMHIFSSVKRGRAT